MESWDSNYFAICFFFFTYPIKDIFPCQNISFYLLAENFSKIWICHHLFKHFHIDRYRVCPFFIHANNATVNILVIDLCVHVQVLL